MQDPTGSGPADPAAAGARAARGPGWPAVLCGRSGGRRWVRCSSLGLVVLLLWVAVWVRFGLSWELVGFGYLAVISVLLAVVDLETHRLPDVIVVPSYPVAGLLLLLPAVAGGQWAAYLGAWLGAVVGFGGYLLVGLVSRGGLGFGDVKLGGLLGLHLGWLGWPELLVGVVCGLLAASVVAVVLVLFAGAGRKSRVPFGPFMLFGAWVAILWGEQLAGWYARVVI